MRGIMISAPNSNSGKTLVTLGLLRYFKNRGLDIRGFKSGPDYIDTKFHEIASGRSAANLDLFMMGREGVKQSVYLNSGEFAVIEGVMGYYDGIGSGYEGSSYDLSTVLNAPAILVYMPQGEMFSAVVKLKGLCDFSNGQIRGILFNKVSEKMYRMLKEKTEEVVGVEVLGYVPKRDDLEIPEEVLGLRFPQEGMALESYLNHAADLLEETIDLKKLYELSEELECSSFSIERKSLLKIAIAQDEAFCFHYADNLRLFESFGEVSYFSPLEEKSIPDCDLLYLGGGFQMQYAKQLSENRAMISSISNYSEKGGTVFSEAGGFEYLNRKINGYDMVGIFDGEIIPTNRLENFGYQTLCWTDDFLIGEAGMSIPVQEYHKSRLLHLPGNCCRIMKPGREDRKGGFRRRNTFGIEQNVNFMGNFSSLYMMMEKVVK